MKDKEILNAASAIRIRYNLIEKLTVESKRIRRAVACMRVDDVVTLTLPNGRLPIAIGFNDLTALALLREDRAKRLKGQNND